MPLPHLPKPCATKTSFDRVNVTDAYRYFVYYRPKHTYASQQTFRRGFMRFLAHYTTDTEYAGGVGWCTRCAYPTHKNSMTNVGGTHLVCRTCSQYYSNCNECDVIQNTNHMYTTVNGHACRTCFSRFYRYCGVCGDYYNWRTQRSDHTHPKIECCESPQTEFVIRYNGEDLLANDTRVTVTLPAGEISEVGLREIAGAVNNQTYYVDSREERDKWIILSGELFNLGTKWQTRDGNYAKRLSRYAYKTHQLKVPPKLMTQVGNIARDHSTAVNFNIETTRLLNLPAYEFANDDSCWWQSYNSSRCSFKTYGGFGVRSFNNAGEVTGRAWVMPLKKRGLSSFEPTFETKSPDAYIVFNGYGVLNSYTPARVLSHIMGMTYRKVRFEAGHMYVNGSSGYLVGAEDVIDEFTDGRVGLSLEQHGNIFTTESKELVNV